MLELFARHGRFDLKVICRGDTHVDYHHTTEDIGIVLGEAFAEALRQKQEKEILFCVGSLYLVGEIKALINRRSTGMEIQI